MKAAKLRTMGLFRPKKTQLWHLRYRGCHFVVAINESVGWRLLTQREYERSAIEVLESVIKPSDTCVDVGANIGVFSVFMARRAHQGKVYVVEPIQLNRRLISLNLGLNGLENTEIIDGVLSDHLGEVDFTVYENSAFSSLYDTWSGVLSIREKTRVPSRTLDSLFAERGERVDVIKIDVEGAEQLVLKGGKALFSSSELRPRAILVEVSSRNQEAYGFRAGDIVSNLEELGYDPHRITADGLRRGWADGDGEEVLFLLSEQNS